jgi:hypothetical protein
MFVFFTSCGGQNKTDLPKEKIKFETKDASTSRWIYTKYEYTDSIGKSLIVQNSFPKVEQNTLTLMARYIIMLYYSLE